MVEASVIYPEDYLCRDNVILRDIGDMLQSIKVDGLTWKTGCSDGSLYLYVRIAKIHLILLFDMLH